MIDLLQTIIGGLLQGSVYAIIALGFSLVYRVTGSINLAQGAFCILSALILYTCTRTLGWPTAVGAVVALVLSTGFGALLGAATFVPVLSRLPESSVLMVTAGLLTLLEGLNLILWGNEPYSLPQFSGEAPLRIGQITFVSQGFWILGTTVAIVLALQYLLTSTLAGKALRACAENPVAARLMGIDDRRMARLSFALAAAVAALGGLVFAPITSFQFDTGNLLTISGFIAASIGGLGSIGGAVVGGLVVGLAEQLASAYVSSLFSHGITLFLLLVMLLWRPSGLFAPRTPRRHDVRDTHQVYRAVTRLKSRTSTALALAGAALAILLPWLPLGDAVLSSLVITGILFIGVIGLDVLMGYAGQVSLGQAGFMAIGAYSAGILATTYEWPPLVGILAGIALSLVCAGILALVTVHLRGHYLALATLTFGLLVDSLTVGLTAVTGGPSGLVGIPSFSIGSFEFDTPMSMYYLVAGLAAAILLLLQGGLRSGFGRALQAIRTDPTAARALGIKVGRFRMAAFAISATLGSLAGSLYAFFFHFLSPEMVSTGRSFEMVTMLVLGGEGTLIGGLFGAAFLTLMPTVFQPFALYKTFAAGALLILVFRFLPEGVYGSFVRLVARWDNHRTSRRTTVSPSAQASRS